MEKPKRRQNQKPKRRLNQKPKQRQNQKPQRRLNQKPKRRQNQKPKRRRKQKPKQLQLQLQVEDQSFFANCTELRKKYPNGVASDHPAYQPKMDRDNDNFACEIEYYHLVDLSKVLNYE